MIKNYFLASFRNITKNKTFTLINVIGLAISLSVGLIMLTFINEAESYDEFHLKGERIFRVTNSYKYLDDDQSGFASTSVLASRLIEEAVPGIAAQVILRRNINTDLVYENKTLPFEGFYASEDFFEIFTFPLINGNPATALADPNSIVLTQSAAEKLFGDESPLGKSLTGQDREFKVTGVVGDPPFNSHLQFEVLISYSTHEGSVHESERYLRWSNMWMYHVYLLLEEESRPGDVLAAMEEINVRQNALDEHTKISMSLQALKNITPGPNLSNELGKTVEARILLMIGSLALIVILSACFNYTNLSIARSLRRSKEVGVRKVVGASSRQVFVQFIFESILIALIALVFAWGMFLGLKPFFLSLDSQFQEIATLNVTPVVVLQFVLLTVATGVLAGALPAFYFSKITPHSVLKTAAKIRVLKGVNLRKILIAMQFTFSLMFILAATLEYNQYKFALDFDLGYNTDNIVNIRLQDNDSDVLENELRLLPEVEDISKSLLVTSVGNYWANKLKYQDPLDSISVYYNGVDHKYLPLHDHNLLAGSNFERRSNDSSEYQVIVNEKLLERFDLGTPDEAIGKVLKMGEDIPAVIVGVIKDFHYGTIQSEVGPFLFRYENDEFYRLNVKFNSANVVGTMGKIEAIWKKIDDVHPLDATFYNDRIQETYGEYLIAVRIIGFLAILAVSIAFMGLLGMVIFTTETRIKEISIRKILGATEFNLVFHLGRGFIVLLIIATGIAVPSTYYLFDTVVFQDLAYKASVGVVELFSGTVVVLLVALAAISSQTVRAARSNPAQVLRNE